MKHQKLYGFLLLVLVVFIAAIIGWYLWFASRGDDNNNTVNNTVVTTQNNTVSNTAASNTTTNNAVANETKEEEKEPEEETSKSGDITVTAPTPNAEVSDPFTVSGYANVFENLVQIRVKDANGVVLLDTYTSTNAPDIGKTGTFKLSAELTKKSSTATGKLEVYAVSPKDGSEQDLVSIPLKFASGAQVNKREPAQ